MVSNLVSSSMNDLALNVTTVLLMVSNSGIHITRSLRQQAAQNSLISIGEKMADIVWKARPVGLIISTVGVFGGS